MLFGQIFKLPTKYKKGIVQEIFKLLTHILYLFGSRLINFKFSKICLNSKLIANLSKKYKITNHQYFLTNQRTKKTLDNLKKV